MKIQRKFGFGIRWLLSANRIELLEFVPSTREKTRLFDCAEQPNGSSESFGGKLLDIVVKAIRPRA